MNDIELLKAKTEALEGAMEEMLNENDELKDRVESLTTSTTPAKTKKTKQVDSDETFVVAGGRYKFKGVAFKLAGVRYNAADALKDAKLLAHIVQDYPGLIVKV